MFTYVYPHRYKFLCPCAAKIVWYHIHFLTSCFNPPNKAPWKCQEIKWYTMVPNCPWGGYAIIYLNNPVCMGFGWARSLVHCGEKVLHSKAVSRIMSLTLFEPVSSSIKGGYIYICPLPTIQGRQKNKKHGIPVWCEHQVRCCVLLFFPFSRWKKVGVTYRVNRRCQIRIVHVPFWEPMILAAMQHCLSSVMFTRHFILYINIHRKHKIEWFSKKTLELHCQLSMFITKAEVCIR